MQKRVKTPAVRKGQGSAAIDREAFGERFAERFYDPRFEALADRIDDAAEAAWKNYRENRKAPRTRKAGEGFADPDYDLSIEWLEARARILAAQRAHDDPGSPSRVLLVCGSSRSDETCPGEMSKTFRLIEEARHTLEREEQAPEIDVLDLSRLTSEYGRNIHPCKGCVSTSMPLCHWPCSCYPNHGLGQVNDWMNEIYPRWVRAHGVLIATPVHWYQAPSVLKLMIDRLVCADGGNPDPTSTSGKDPEKAKKLEMAGWSYPRHLAGRAFSVVVHGDTAGVDELTAGLTRWLEDMHLVPAGRLATVGRYIGYYEPYATSHDELDDDEALRIEVANAARALAAAVRELRAGDGGEIGADEPRPK